MYLFLLVEFRVLVDDSSNKIRHCVSEKNNVFNKCLVESCRARHSTRPGKRNQNQYVRACAMAVSAFHSVNRAFFTQLLLKRTISRRLRALAAANQATSRRDSMLYRDDSLLSVTRLLLICCRLSLCACLCVVGTRLLLTIARFCFSRQLQAAKAQEAAYVSMLRARLVFADDLAASDLVVSANASSSSSSSMTTSDGVDNKSADGGATSGINARLLNQLVVDFLLRSGSVDVARQLAADTDTTVCCCWFFFSSHVNQCQKTVAVRF